MDIDKTISQEKAKVSQKTDFFEHDSIFEKWSGVETILDAISKEIPPFIEEEIRVKIDLPSLRVNKNTSDWILKFLLSKKICGSSIHKQIEEKGKVVASSTIIEPIEKYLGGLIIVYDVNQLEEIKNKIVKLCNWIEEDSIKRFPQDYSPESSTNKFENSVHDKERVYTPDIPKKKLKNATSYPFPRNTTWEQVKIQFLDADTLEIFIKGKHFKKLSSEDIHFYQGTKQKKHDKKWEFLQKLAVIQSNLLGTITIDTMSASLKIKRENCMQVKSNLAEKLQELFCIDEDPFFDYKVKNCYQTKFELLPERLLRHAEDPYRIGRNYNEETDYIEDETSIFSEDD